jgi:hypothetical protein
MKSNVLGRYRRMDVQFQSFEEFWPFYLKAHDSRLNRLLHMIGTLLGLGLLFYGLFSFLPFFILLAFVLGYGLAWIGHFLIEGNHPATFKFPIWSFMGDLKMTYLILKKRSLKI